MEKFFISVESFLKIFNGFYDICGDSSSMQKTLPGPNQEFIVYVCCDIELTEEVVIIKKKKKILVYVFL